MVLGHPKFRFQSHKITMHLHLLQIHSECNLHFVPKLQEQHSAYFHLFQKLYLRKLLQLAGNTDGKQQVTAVALMHVNTFMDNAKTPNDPAEKAHQMYMNHQIKQFMADPSGFKLPEAPALPDGSPIGCGHE